MTTAEINARFPGELDRRADKYHWTFPGGESYADARTRAARALSTITADGARRPLIVSYEMIGRMLVLNQLGLDPQGSPQLPTPA